jgi:hypothetical protein
MTRMFVTSLKLIEQEFQKRVHGKDLERYVSRNYVSKVEGRWQIEKGGFWAKLWLYYCLGMKEEVLEMLLGGNRDFRDLTKLYNATEEALALGRPIKTDYNTRYDVEDVFYDQFVFNITGQSRYACELIAEPLSLELVMIIIRTLGVYYETDASRFNDIRKGLLKKYRDRTADTQIMRNILYLLDYDEIVKMGPNALMSRDDYLHFLIILSGYSSLVDKELLVSKLSEMLTQFIL